MGEAGFPPFGYKRTLSYEGVENTPEVLKDVFRTGVVDDLELVNFVLKDGTTLSSMTRTPLRRAVTRNDNCRLYAILIDAKHNY
jgi:hypothetical protein